MWDWWFDTPSRPLWRHYDVLLISFLLTHGPCIASMLGTDTITYKARENHVHIHWDVSHCTFQMFTMSCNICRALPPRHEKCLVTVTSQGRHGVSNHTWNIHVLLWTISIWMKGKTLTNSIPLLCTRWYAVFWRRFQEGAGIMFP